MTRAEYKPGQIVLLHELLERLARLAAESGAIGVIEVENNLFKINRGPGYNEMYLNATGKDHNPPKE